MPLQEVEDIVLAQFAHQKKWRPSALIDQVIGQYADVDEALIKQAVRHLMNLNRLDFAMDLSLVQK